MFIIIYQLYLEIIIQMFEYSQIISRFFSVNYQSNSFCSGTETISLVK